jgi:tripartite-type tricarboxylate transporter receptor subunit TctC
MAALSRRRFFSFASGAALLSTTSRVARSQTYPSRSVRIIVGFAAGGPQDIVARILAQSLSDRLGQPFIVENRTGAGGNIGTEAVVRAGPDGYTILLGGTSNAVNATLYEKLNFNFARDIAPVAGVIRTTNILEVNLSLPVKTVPEFIAYAQQHPGKIRMGSPGAGTLTHMAGELFQAMTGVKFLHVPYRGAAPALTDLLAGQVDIMFESLASAIGQIKAGRVRALAVTTAARSEAVPDLPTIGEFVPNFEASAWYGVGAPKDAPKEVIVTLNAAINASLNDPRIKARLAELGGTVIPGSPNDFAKLIEDEIAKWAKVVRFAGLKSS